jgi:outer membrane protein assembly factor BamB
VVTPTYCGACAILLAVASLGSAPKPNDTKPGPIPILPAVEVWARDFKASPAANAWMDDERVYVPLRALGLRALSRDTGEPVWDMPVDLSHPPLAVGARLVLPLPDEIRGVDPATGRIIWSRPLTEQLAAPVSAADDRVLLLRRSGELMALRASDGEPVWRRELGAATSYAPARVSANAIVLTLADGRVLALDDRSGETIWVRSLPGSLSAPAVGRDRVLVGSTNNFFYALDARSGAERWRWRTGGDVVGAAAAGDRVYFVSLDNVLRAVDRDNGNQLWKAALATRPASPPVAFDDVVVFAGLAPRVDAYDGRTGESLGTFTAPSDLEGVPLIDTTPTPFEVAVVTLTRDGRLSALRPTGLMFPDPPLAPLQKLPGRELPRERLPAASSFQLPAPKESSQGRFAR